MADRTTTITLRVNDAFSAALTRFQGGLAGAEHGLQRLDRAGASLRSVGMHMSIGG